MCMMKNANMLGILAIVLALTLIPPSVSAVKSVKIGLPSNVDPFYTEFANNVGFQWQGGLSGGFNLSWSDGFVFLQPKLKHVNGNEYTPAEVKALIPEVNFQMFQTNMGSHWKFAINMSNIPVGQQGNFDRLIFELTDSAGVTPQDYRKVGNNVIIKDKYAFNFFDLFESFTIEFINKSRVEFGNIQANIVDGTLFIDPYVQPYPYNDGYLERDEYGVFDVYLTDNTLRVGNNDASTDLIYRAYLKFNTTVIDPWDELVNATFHLTVNAETCGAGNSSVFWVQSIADYVDLGESDWSVTSEDLNPFYFAPDNSTGDYIVNVSDGIVKGGITAFRLKGTYEQYGGVNCFIKVRSNESANEPYIEIYWNDGSPDTYPPAVTIHSPQNTTYYDNHAVSLDVSANETVTQWYYDLNGAGNQTFTPNITITAQNGSNHVIVWAKDEYDNWGFEEVYFTFQDNLPVVVIFEPENTSYECHGFDMPLKVGSSEAMDSWFYDLNGLGNVSFVPNSTLSSGDLHCGGNTLIVCANDTTGNWDCETVHFTVTMIVGNETIALALYYAPFAQVGVQQTIYAIVKGGGLNYQLASVEIELDNSTAYMVWDNATESYIVYWIPSENGDYPFLVSAVANNTVNATGSIKVATPFNVTVRLWNNINMTPTSRYRNEFAWIYMTRELSPTLKRLFGRDRFACPPQGIDECYWHGKYVNGTAVVTLYEEGNYSIYIIGNNVKFQQVMPSGAVVDCEFCEPWVIQTRFRLNLGDYYLDEPEEIDLYYSTTELYVFGAVFGVFASWLGFIVIAGIGVAFFFILLFATHSLKSALAGLLLLPTIIYLILTLTLW